MPLLMRTRLKFWLLGLLVVAGVATGAWAAMTVIDPTSITKLVEQINALQEQTEVVTDMRDKVQDQIDAVGQVGQITLPSVGGERLRRGLIRDAACLLPDHTKLMPSLDFEDADFGSFCAARKTYSNSLFVQPAAEGKALTPQQRSAALRQVQRRRERVMSDATVAGLAKSEDVLRRTKTMNETMDRLRTARSIGATDVRRQLAISNETMGIIAQNQIIQTELLAQILRLQSAGAAHLGLPTIEELEKPTDG